MGGDGALQVRGWQWGFGGEVGKWRWVLLTRFALGAAEVGRAFQCAVGEMERGS